MATRMQQRRGTAAEWTAANPILAAGEFGYETDTGKFKIGDGTNTWSNIEAFSDASALLGAAPDTLDTLGELATAIGDNPTFFSVVAGNTDAIADLTEGLVTTVSELTDAIEQSLENSKTYSDDKLSTAITAETLARESSDTTISTNLASLTQTVTDLSTTVSTSDGTLQDNINAEEAARTLAVSNLDADLTTEETSRIAGDAELQDNIDAEETARIAADDANSAAILAEETARIAADLAHSSATTGVHGIADTSLLATTSDVSAAQTAAEGYADGLASNYDAAGSAATAQTAAEGYADGAVTTHNAATTSVHGIADTSKIVMSDAVSTTLDGALVVSGDLTVNGTNFAASATSITIEDNIVQLAHTNAANTVDLGLVVAYNDGAAKHSGIVRDVSADSWKLFKGVSTEPSTTVEFTEGSLDDLAVNNVTVAGVVFTDGTQTKVGVPSITPIAEKTASYTLSSSDERDTVVEVNSSSATTVTIPLDEILNFPVGSTLDVIQTGTGQVTIAGSGAAVVNATPGLKLRAQWSSVTLLKRAANSWLVFGDTSA